MNTVNAIAADLLDTLELITQLLRIGQISQLPIICRKAIVKAQADLAAANATKGISPCSQLDLPDSLPSAVGYCVD